MQATGASETQRPEASSRLSDDSGLPDPHAKLQQGRNRLAKSALAKCLSSTTRTRVKEVSCRSDRLSAGVPGDTPREVSGACENAARSAEARDAEASRSCCKFPAVRPRRAASVRARGIPDSGIARSSRAGIAFWFASQKERWSGGAKSGLAPERTRIGKAIAPKTERIVRRPCLVCQAEFIPLVGGRFPQHPQSFHSSAEYDLHSFPRPERAISKNRFRWSSVDPADPLSFFRGR